MDFVLFHELRELSGGEIAMLLISAVFSALIAIGLAGYLRSGRPAPANRTRALVYGALCVALSFMLSFIKLFSLPMGGSLTLCSMLPLAAYACAFGPGFGFAAALAYGLLQVVQGAWVVHWAQFLLDYILAFACYGIASLFPGRLPLGIAASGLGRLICSTLSGAVFFAAYAAEAGWANAWLYSLAYNGITIGAEVALCLAIALTPPVRRVVDTMKA